MFRSPSQAGLPELRTMLDDVGEIKKLAVHLDLTEQTLKRYAKANEAPRAVMLAVFWETKWGRSAADCEAANYGALHYQVSKGLRRKIDELTLQIATLEKALAEGNRAANSPSDRPEVVQTLTWALQPIPRPR